MSLSGILNFWVIILCPVVHENLRKAKNLKTLSKNLVFSSPVRVGIVEKVFKFRG